MPLQSKFVDNEKLRNCEIRDIDHIGEIFAPTGPHVALIQEALNTWAAKQTPPVPQILVNGRFTKETGDIVALYKTKHSPPILNYKGQIDRIVGKKTVVALDRELPAKNGGSTISPEMQLVNAADTRRLAALMKAELEIRRLKRMFEPDVPDENDHVVQAMQRQIFIPMDGRFWVITNQLLSMIVSNRLIRSHFQIDRSKPEFAHVEPDIDPGKGITACNSFFLGNDNCRHEVITHEFFHFIVGAQHFYSTKTNEEAMKCPHHLARAVFDIALGQQLAPCSGSDTVCK